MQAKTLQDNLLSLSGIPIEKSALTVNQVCGSGLRVVSLAAQSILTNQSNIIIAGGQESMSNAHHTINLRNGLKMGDGNIKDSMIVDGLWCAMNDYHMGTTAENIAEMYGIQRMNRISLQQNLKIKQKMPKKIIILIMK